MHYRHITEHCFDDRIGARGAAKKRVDQLLASFTSDSLSDSPAAVALLATPARTADIAGIRTLAADIRKRFKRVVIAGAGGSSLSGRTLAALTLGATSPTLYFLENIDPDAIDAVSRQCNPKETFYIFISKSGETAETLAQFYALIGGIPATQCLVISSATDNALRSAAHERGIRVLDHDPGIGGRFAVLTNVGLLPAAIAGLDIAAFRRGAQSVIDQPEAAKLGAALHVALLEKQYTISVLLPYAERLSGLSSWWRQGWAESLGKNGKGTTPIRALGSTDQHSQLQLYLDGPKDKFFHLITLDRANTGQKIAAPLAYLNGKTTGDLMAAEQKATLETLIKNQCPVRHFALQSLTEETMGALLMHFMLEIIFTAELLSVNPFDQPAVEEGKRLAREYLLTGKL